MLPTTVAVSLTFAFLFGCRSKRNKYILILFLNEIVYLNSQDIQNLYNMAWRSHGKTNAELVRNLRGKFLFINYK